MTHPSPSRPLPSGTRPRHRVAGTGALPTLRRAASAVVLAVVGLGIGASGSGAQEPEKRRLTFTDLMQFRQIEELELAESGAWLAFTARPDRGDPEVVIHATDGSARWSVPVAEAPAVSADGAWVAARTVPTLEERETREEDERTPPGLALVETATGETERVEGVRAFAFSPDGAWLAIHLREADTSEPEEPGEDPAATPGAQVEGETGGAADDDAGPAPGTPLLLRHLASGEETRIEHVTRMAFHPEGLHLATVVSDGGPGADGVHLRSLEGGVPGDPVPVGVAQHLAVPELAWSEDGRRLAFLAAPEPERGEPGPGALWLWDGDAGAAVVEDGEVPSGWDLDGDGLRFSDDGERIFVELAAEEAAAPEDEGEAEGTEGGADDPFDPYDVGSMVEERRLQVWHWEDQRIAPQREVEAQRGAPTYTAVYHPGSDRLVPLENAAFELVGTPSNPRVGLARVRQPYQRAYTWDTWYFDAWAVELETGERMPVAQRLSGDVELSPGGRYVAFYDTGQWSLQDRETGQTRVVTAALPVSFAQEDWDYPGPAGSYGTGGWVEGDRALLLYDRYDVWWVPTDGGEPLNLTGGEGRAEGRTFRVVRTDRDAEALDAEAPLLLSSFHHPTKRSGFWRARPGEAGVERLVEDEKVFRFRAAAEDADVWIISREDYDEFPDLWVTGPDLRSPRKLTEVNPRLEEFWWGTEELVEWTSADGIPLQGALFKPEDFEPGKRYPVLVYFYRLFSQRLHEFNEPVVNHRPSFPMYTSNGYLVFLPDVRFEVGQPGFSATKALVPGVQKLVEMGIADPDGLGLHGHSWSGYQTAHVITQTDIFDAAVAGAPVSNMTSAYGGIRWGSGLARQFQYERTQSRLGGSLWEARDEYIDNSPLFFADRIDTPVVLMHGDEDDAVPWYQSIELYLALRRLDKPAVFLQYEGEPHHLRRYANKLDYSIKMMEFFDHHLKGAPAPDWWAEGSRDEGGPGEDGAVSGG